MATKLFQKTINQSIKNEFQYKNSFIGLPHLLIQLQLCKINNNLFENVLKAVSSSRATSRRKIKNWRKKFVIVQ